MAMQADESVQRDDTEPRVLPHHVTFVLTIQVDASELTGSLFRPCEAGGDWQLEEETSERYSDFDPTLAQELRQASPHFTALYDQPSLLSVISPDVSVLRATFFGFPVTLTLANARLGLTDLGYGATALEYAVRPGGEEPRDGELVDLTTVNSLLEPMGELVSPLMGDLSFPHDVKAVGTRCLWGHVLYSFDVSNGIPVDILAPDAEPDGSHLSLDLAPATLKPGLGSSIVVGADESLRRKIVRVLALASAYYAAAAEFDRMVFRNLQDRLKFRGNLSVFDRAFEEISVFRAVMSTLDLHLAASTALEVRVWGRYAVAWRLDRQLDALNEKLTLLRAFQDREASRVSLQRNQKLTVIVSVFTVLGFVGTLLDLVEFGQENSLSNPDAARTGLSILFVALVAAIFGMWARRRANPSNQE